VSVDIASEFRYRKIKFKKDCLYVFVSQSGETADTFAALDLCKKNNVKTCAVVNVVESSIARDADLVLPIHCGPEVGVASTKAFLGQMLVLYLLCTKLSYEQKSINKKDYQKKIKDLLSLSKSAKNTLNIEDKIQTLGKDFANSKGSMILGRCYSYPIALEGALKLKEISYIHAAGYPAGEMKHGPIALLDKKVPVISIASPGEVFDKVISNAQEAKARDSYLIGIAPACNGTEIFDYLMQVPFSNEWISPLLNIVPLQLLSYHIAAHRGLDVDQPRNLAKSVTVE